MRHARYSSGSATSSISGASSTELRETSST
jgi:hypothetical protein